MLHRLGLQALAGLVEGPATVVAEGAVQVHAAAEVPTATAVATPSRTP